MSFIIKNPHDHPLTVGGVTFDPKQQLTFHTLEPEINAALDRGDLTLTLETPGEHIDLKPFHTGDKAIDG
jgi:quercetin dioxygenase-like cupin family protein